MSGCYALYPPHAQKVMNPRVNVEDFCFIGRVDGLSQLDILNANFMISEEDKHKCNNAKGFRCSESNILWKISPLFCFHLSNFWQRSKKNKK